ncbi:hypothetical protein ARTSIC4J27_2327 [Pseudarthrobacter siccitolerans]|uniref:Uncharacterized protein n=1 Tax=Pseudarthrobacter siccitolerans TaxID=861266 RepID=A0A024H3L9_9MICC|nr:alpha/beta hydrolase [Pseudarthrobacter siccitolerans]CCQ46364.1 hypothetical protein ARTSIC4J27_2327 [Pseudarthrobacter siccitolerans]
MWTSRGSGHQLAYHADEDSIIAAERPLYDFLTTLHDLPDVGPVHVLAHSMGCRAALRAVVRAADSGMAPFELGELILAAPDVSEKYSLKSRRSYRASLGAPPFIHPDATVPCASLNSSTMPHE